METRGRGSLNVLVTAAEILRHQRMPEKYKLYDLKSRPQGGETYIIPWSTLTHGFDVYRRK